MRTIQRLLPSRCHPVFISQQYMSSKPAVLKKKKKNRGGPKWVDPLHPKRPMNAFLRFWVFGFQPEFLGKNKQIGLTNSAKIAGSEWFHLGEIQREQYQAEAQAEWDEYRDKIKKYRENDGLAKWKQTKESLPQKMYAKSPYVVYIKQNYKGFAANSVNQNRNHKEIIQDLAAQWRESDDSVKAQYKHQWAKEKEEFLKKYGKYLRTINDKK